LLPIQVIEQVGRNNRTDLNGTSVQEPQEIKQIERIRAPRRRREVANAQMLEESIHHTIVNAPALDPMTSSIGNHAQSHEPLLEPDLNQFHPRQPAPAEPRKSRRVPLLRAG
jgi:hypothetical protein